MGSSLEAKYKEYNCKWILFLNGRYSKINIWLKLIIKIFRTPNGKILDDTKIYRFPQQFPQSGIGFRDNYELDDEDMYRIIYLIENHEKRFSSDEPYILVKNKRGVIISSKIGLCVFVDTQEPEKLVTNAIVNIYRKYNNCYDKEICICTSTGKALKNIMRKIKSGKDQSDDNINYGTCHRMFNFTIPKYIRYLNDKDKYDFDIEEFNKTNKRLIHDKQN